MHQPRRTGSADQRLALLTAAFVVFGAILLGRTLFLPFSSAASTAAPTGPQPIRGSIELASRIAPGSAAPLATNEKRWLLAGDPKVITDPATVAAALVNLLGGDSGDLTRRLANRRTSHAVLVHGLTDGEKNRILASDLPGITLEPELIRVYPLGTSGAHVSGFLGYQGTARVGQYGLEAYYDRILRGSPGNSAASVVDGSDILTTIDRSLEDFACARLHDAIVKHGADGGSLVMVDPKTGAVLAMCGEPSFDPNHYGDALDASVFLNPAITSTYEPGSVFKTFTMASALDVNALTPSSTYEDTGSVTIGRFTIRNSDGEAHGVQTMSQVLEESLNTGAIYVAQKVGSTVWSDALRRFGFGEKTHIDLTAEAAGNVAKSTSGKEIYLATGSYGQGLTVTALQLTMAYAAIANRGVLMQPYVVDRIIGSDGRITETQPRAVRSVISPATATTLSAMLVGVVERGHGKRAGVPGYYIAGKTGTAQISSTDRAGYEPGVTIGTFAGFGPVEDPRFAMVVRIDRPRDVQFAESSAAPLFGEIAAYTLRALGVAPTRTNPVP
jgi:cell division protein FtsI/penicillin-binding protein 2